MRNSFAGFGCAALFGMGLIAPRIARERRERHENVRRPMAGRKSGWDDERRDLAAVSCPVPRATEGCQHGKRGGSRSIGATRASPRARAYPFHVQFIADADGRRRICIRSAGALPLSIRHRRLGQHVNLTKGALSGLRCLTTFRSPGGVEVLKTQH